MNDQERLSDLLMSEKKMSANYDTYASECVNTRLRDQFLQILTTSHKTQSELFDQAKNKGWYQVEQAPTSKVDTAFQKFSNTKPSVQ